MGDHSAEETPSAPSKVSYLKDALERVASSAVGGFLTGVVGTWTGAVPASVSEWKVWLTAAAVTGAVSALKSALASVVGDRDSAAFLPLPKK